MRITSPSNPLIKHLNRLITCTKTRRELGEFVVEGKKELSTLLDSDYQIDKVFVCERLFNSNDMACLESKSIDKVYITKPIYEKLSYRKSTEGVLALVKQKHHSLKGLKLTKNMFILVLDAIEKPGNVGAIIRSAKAIDVNAIIFCDLKTDIYNPNVIRASLGHFFTMKVAVSGIKETSLFLLKNKISIYTTFINAESKNLFDTTFDNASAVVLGAEDKGVRPQWREVPNKAIKIPMKNTIDSLNVSVSTGVILYEYYRQKNNKL